jgi:hypothetical protein
MGLGKALNAVRRAFEVGFNRILVRKPIPIGERRVQRLVKHFGKAVVSTSVKIKVPGVGSTDIDVVLTGKRLIEVGGPGKNINPSHFGRQLHILSEYARGEGGSAFFYYDVGTPPNIINLAKKWVGEANVKPIP